MMCYTVLFSDGSTTIKSAHTSQLAMNKAKTDNPDKQPMLASMTGNWYSPIF